jgi:transcriptional regulator with XRE-family HTH domain
MSSRVRGAAECLILRTGANVFGAIRRTGRRQNSIAEQAGVSPVTLSKILTGGHANPRFATVVAITHAAGENVGWLLGEQGFSLSGDHRYKVRTAAEVLMDLTGGKRK